MKTLEYYWSDGTHAVFEKYIIDENGVIISLVTGTKMTRCLVSGYNRVSVRNIDGKLRHILVGRALASTFLGRPPTVYHTADHKDRISTNDVLSNIRWLDKTGQSKNQTRPAVYKNAFVIVRDGVERTAKEWTKVLEKSYGGKYTSNTVSKFARQGLHGFRYKVFQNLPREVWKFVEGSENTQGKWYVSSRSRIKYKTSYAEHVLFADQLTNISGYPVVKINGKHWTCHELSFKAFRPREYASKAPDEIILHKQDNKLDFGPFRLRLGSPSQNGIDAHDNGKYDDTKSVRKTVASYVNDVVEKIHESINAAVRYLQDIGYSRADTSNVRIALRKGVARYDRTWKFM